ncbi:hypothetical protein [Tenacibaculum sp. 190524A05c]|uniref:hypothetical protein n=1 Tax=Tenacibaculum platacis TaxID=3137852 RepID=UPI0032B1CCB7
MKNIINHKPFILIGCIIWITSFFRELTRLQPYSTIGIIISPMILLFGVIIWFKYYKKTRGYFPKFLETYSLLTKRARKNPFVISEFTFKHILEFWTFLIIFWMGLCLIIILTFGQSDAFKTTKQYCRNNTEITQKTGKIKYFGLLMSGNITTRGKNGESNITFTIVGENGIFKTNAELIRDNDRWE